MREEIEIFRKRALEAFEGAKLMFERGFYDWAMVLLEQAIQLLLKYFLALKVGYFSKTHELRKLFEEAALIDKRFWNFYLEYKDKLEVLDEAYISGRYLNKTYPKEDVEDKFMVFEKLLELINEKA
jgi:HEPN domain-containing protein